jgi:type I restriction enzyme S subunit
MIPKSSKFERYVISNKQLRFRVDSLKADPEFVYYWLASPWIKKAIENRNTGSTVPLINLGIIKSLPISLPEDIQEQRKISHLLSAIDEKIELNNKINAELEAMAKLIYDYWFVQFDFPAANDKPYKSCGGKMVYNEELKREIPDGWNSYTLGSILNTELGGTPSTKVSEYWKGQIPWLDSGEVANFPIIESEKYISESAIINSATKLMPKGTCTLSITRHLRPSILAVSACVNQSVVGIFENKEIKNSYIYPYLVNEIPRLMTLRTGAQQPHINKGIVDVSPVLIPPNEILNAYYEKVDTLYNQINNNAFQNKELTALRDWLLPMLMNGQVTVNQ